MSRFPISNRKRHLIAIDAARATNAQGEALDALATRSSEAQEAADALWFGRSFFGRLKFILIGK